MASLDSLMPSSPKQRVLVVEDDPRMLALVCQGLREVGHTPALKRAFDSIILDIGLPARDGCSVARAIADEFLAFRVHGVTVRGDADRGKGEAITDGADHQIVAGR